MDSISQFVLGAAVGELVSGKKAGAKTLWWGGIAGTIPDLDIVFNPLFSQLDQLAVHRGFSHSLVFSFITAPVLGWLLHKMYSKNSRLLLIDWIRLFFWAIITHPLLDSFTLYGTQLFLPFSNYRVAFNTISIIDPVYTLPLLICGIFVLIMKKRRPALAEKINKTGLLLSSLYLLLTVFNKFYVDSIFEKSLRERNIANTVYMSNPVLFSNLLWYAVARDDSTCYIGYYSLLQNNKNITFEAFPRNEHLMHKIRDKEGYEKLKWFSKNYYVAEERNDTLCFFDVRFGKTDLFTSKDYEQTFVFYFKIPEPEGSPLRIVQYISRKDMDFHEFLFQLKRRIFEENE